MFVYCEQGLSIQLSSFDELGQQNTAGSWYLYVFLVSYLLRKQDIYLYFPTSFFLLYLSYYSKLVNIWQPVLVTAIVCSKWADKEPSAVSRP